MTRTAALAALLLALPAGARAQEAISTAAASDPGPPAAEAAASPSDEDPGDWARRVLAGQPAPADPQAASTRCPAASPDGRPHGEVWAGIGTRGYRELGGVVTQPIGKCGAVTIAVSKTDGPRWPRR